MAISASGDGYGQWDGTLTLAVGAPGANDGEGAVYVGRTAEHGKWTSPFRFLDPLQPYFPDADEEFRTQGFGSCVALTGGVTLAVGAPFDPNFDDMIEGTGAVWIFNYAEGSFVRSETQPPVYGPAEGAQFGASIAFPETFPSYTADETYVLEQAPFLLVGAPGPAEGETASAFLYINDVVEDAPAGATFSPSAQFVSSSPQEGDGFGSSVAASTYDLGTWCLVGAPGNPKADQDGGGYLYADGDPRPAWMDTPRLVAEPPLRWGGLPPDWWKKFTPQIEKYLD